MSDETTVETTAPEVTVEAEAPKLATAFVIAIGENGGVYLERNLDALKIPVEREVTLIEVRRYISEILMDLQAQAAAEYTITALNQVQGPQA